MEDHAIDIAGEDVGLEDHFVVLAREQVRSATGRGEFVAILCEAGCEGVQPGLGYARGDPADRKTVCASAQQQADRNVRFEVPTDAVFKGRKKFGAELFLTGGRWRVGKQDGSAMPPAVRRPSAGA